jgi:hypothetical protein
VCTCGTHRPSSPGRDNSQAPAQTGQLAATSGALGLAKRVGDGFADKHVVMDPLRNQLLGVSQDPHALVPFCRRLGRDRVRLAAGAGQQLRVHRLGDLERLAVLAVLTVLTEFHCGAGTPDPDGVGPKHNCAQVPTSVPIGLLAPRPSLGWVAAAAGGLRRDRQRGRQMQHPACLHGVVVIQLAGQCLRGSGTGRYCSG